MVDKAEQILSEVQQIKTQYVAEVGKGRRIWPRSIKDRVAELDKMGVPAKIVAERSGIPYETIIMWRYHRRHKSETGAFHELKVGRGDNLPAVHSGKSISKSVTVTVPKNEIPVASQAAVLRLTTPGGFIVDGLGEAVLVRLLTVLAGGAHGL